MVQKNDYDPKKELAALTEKALKGRGFVLFMGVLTDKKDKDGNFVLDFHYTRSKYGFEDLPKAIAAFKQHCANDALSLMK